MPHNFFMVVIPDGWFFRDSGQIALMDLHKQICWEHFWWYFLSLEIRWLYWNLYLARWDTCFGQKTGQCSSQFLLDQDMCVHSRDTTSIGWDGSKCCRFFRTAISLRIYALLITRVYLWSHSSLLLVICSYAVSSLQWALPSWTKLWWCCEIPIETYMWDS